MEYLFEMYLLVGGPLVGLTPVGKLFPSKHAFNLCLFAIVRYFCYFLKNFEFAKVYSHARYNTGTVSQNNCCLLSRSCELLVATLQHSSRFISLVFARMKQTKLT